MGNNNTILDEQLSTSKRWSVKRIQDYYYKHTQNGKFPLVGCNFVPSNAINQLEFWDQDKFDVETTRKELKLIHDIGMNIIRVYLHHIQYGKNGKKKERMFKRMKQLIAICKDLDIKILFVFFDDCWNKKCEEGVQPDPIPGVHNSGWVQSNEGNFGEMREDIESYIKDTLEEFKSEPQIFGWDLYNEPGNKMRFKKSMNLVKQVFIWARSIKDLSQPVTVGMWVFPSVFGVQYVAGGFKDFNMVSMEYSDFISFHCYTPPSKLLKTLEYIEQYSKEFDGEIGRNIICTEYMGRTAGSLFKDYLPILTKRGIGAINWGCVQGKTQTEYPWTTTFSSAKTEPKLWFHEIFRKDHTPYKIEEIKLIKKYTNHAKKVELRSNESKLENAE